MYKPHDSLKKGSIDDSQKTDRKGNSCMTIDIYDPIPMLVIAEDKAVKDGLLRQFSLWAEARSDRIRFLPRQGTVTRRPAPIHSVLGLMMKDRMTINVSRNRKKEIRQVLEQWRRDRGHGV